MDSSLSSYTTVTHRGNTLFLEACLLGGAPWGFQLKGGLEHGEELIISKVEGGGKADLLEHPLLPGDQVVVINNVELSGFRQEAISLVKGSYKILRLTVRRQFYFGDPTTLTVPSHSPLPPNLTPTDPPSTASHGPLRETREGSCGGVKLRIKNRRSAPASRPHSWHSTKLGEGQSDPNMMQMAPSTMGPGWHQTYHSSASTTDLSGYDPGYLRKSPDQYSSRGSMESLGDQGQQAYSSSCHQLSASKSSNSIDHLHSKRDSAYSSFSTSSSIPEYLAATPTFCKERSYSMEMVPQRGGVNGGGAVVEDIQQADIHYVHTVYDPQQGGAQEHEVSSTTLLRNHEAGRAGPRIGGGASCHRVSSSSSGGSSGGVNYTNNPNRHSVGHIWVQSAGRSSNESLKGAPAPPMRSDSYAAIRNHERPNSWSSLEQARSLRALHKGSWHHSSGSVASGSGKGSYGTEGQLHTVIEKSPESSPTTKPKQGQSVPPPPQSQQTSTQSGRLLLSQGIYPVPPLEPHYAQMPTSSPGSVFPALARENSLGPGVSVDTGMVVENGYQSNTSHTRVNSGSSQPKTDDSAKPTPSTLPGQPLDRGGDTVGHVETNPGQYRPHLKEEVKAVYQSQNQQSQETDPGQQAYQERRDPYTPVQPRGPSWYAQGSEYPPDNHRQWQNREEGKRTVPSHSQPHPQPENTISGKVCRSRSVPAQGPEHQVQQKTQMSNQQGNDQRSRSPIRHYSDPSPPHMQSGQRGLEHPLTRLENALAEVQRCASPEGSARNSYQRSLSVLEKVNHFEQSQGKQRSQSISTSPGAPAHPSQPQYHDRTVGYGAGMVDLRNMLERSSSPGGVHRTLSSRSHRGRTVGAHQGHPCKEQPPRGVCEQSQSSMHPEHQCPDPQKLRPVSALQRSRSTFQLGGQGGPEENGNDSDRDWGFHLKDDLQDLLGTIKDKSFNRTYRDSIKDAQSKVLRSTSFRRKDLGVHLNPASGENNHLPAVPTKHLSLERKAVPPKTSPKPCLVNTTVPGPATATSSNPHTPKQRHTIPTPDPTLVPATSPSPHTPKQRHVVTPKPESFSPPELPGVSAVGPAVPTRIGGRKRLTAEQKKRSYSEPENMHEVGLESDPRRPAQQQLMFLGTETSVADRRRMFEMAASRSLSSSSQPYQGLQGAAAGLAVSRPELRQLQQNALADYMERKRGWKTDRSEGVQQHRERPHSAYLQPFTDNQSVSSTSTSSLVSLQEPPAHDTSLSGARLCSTLPPGLQGFYPGRVSAPRIQAPASATSSRPTGSVSDRLQEGEPHMSGLSRGKTDKAYEALRSQGFSQRGNGAFDRAAPARSSGKSVSAEDLLERSERPPPQHFRSRSSPSVERLNQDFMAEDLRLFGIASTEPRLFTHNDNNRFVDIHCPERPVSCNQSRAPAHQESNYPLNQDLSQSNASVMRRERQRYPDRQRALSASGLAASVGLPCPFSPPGTSPTTSLDWEASERLSQANLDAITFPSLLQRDAPGAETQLPQAPYQSQARCPWSREGSSDTSSSEDTLKDFPQEREGSCTQAPPDVPKTPPPVLPKTSPPPTKVPETPAPPKSSPPPPPPKPPLSASRPHPLISLRISESSLLETTPLEVATPTVSLQDYDEVFFQELAPPPPPPPPSLLLRETDITENFPPPPLPLLPPSFPPDMEKDVEQSHVITCTSSVVEVVCPERLSSSPSPSTQSVSSSPFPFPGPSLTPEPQPDIPTESVPSTRVPEPQQWPKEEESLGPEFHLLARRERSAGEQRVEALVKLLVSRGDKTLTPLLDTWTRGGQTSAMDLMEEIFLAGGGRLLWQRRRSSTWLENRKPEGVSSEVLDDTQGGELETNLDEEEADLNQKKVSLFQALTLSLTSLRGERESLAEEQRKFGALGGQIESLVQECCKPNEKEKYRMFIGDLDKIVNLLLSLCLRLARVDNALLALDREEDTEGSAEERESLQQKRRQLCSQHEDARELKENLDRRECVVLDILGGYLTGPQLRDYQHYVRMKPALLIRQRQLDELIRHGDEELCKLAESLSIGDSTYQGPLDQQGQPTSPGPSSGSNLDPGLRGPNFDPTHTARSTTVTSL